MVALIWERDAFPSTVAGAHGRDVDELSARWSVLAIGEALTLARPAAQTLGQAGGAWVRSSIATRRSSAQVSHRVVVAQGRKRDDRHNS